MKSLFFIAAISLMAFICFSQLKSKDTETEIIKLENDWMNAMMHKDSIILNQIISPDFKLEGTKDLDRPAVSKAQWMTNTMHHLNVDSINFMKIKTEVNDNFAIARCSFFWKASFDKEPFTDSAFLVDVWIKKNNRWQVITRMISE